MKRMELFRTEQSGCANGCPYYRSPPLDFPIQQRYHYCQLQYKESLDLEKLDKSCPLRTIEEVLEDFMKYIKKYNLPFEDIVNFQLDKQIVLKFIMEELWWT